jgi:single-strand DNA-binding protein
MNKSILIGNLTSDPRMINTSTNKLIARFTVAVNLRYKDSRSGEYKEFVDYIDISAWGKLAEKVNDECKKGTRVFISGRIKTSEYVDKDGNNRKGFEVQADEIHALARSSKGETRDDSHQQEENNEDYSIEDEIII